MARKPKLRIPAALMCIAAGGSGCPTPASPDAANTDAADIIAADIVTDEPCVLYRLPDGASYGHVCDAGCTEIHDPSGSVFRQCLYASCSVLYDSNDAALQSLCTDDAGCTYLGTPEGQQIGNRICVLSSCAACANGGGCSVAYMVDGGVYAYQCNDGCRIMPLPDGGTLTLC